MAAPIEHTGRVERVEADTVYVTITSSSACGSCKARQACGLAEAQEKTVVVRCADAAQYAPGDDVTVGVRRSAGALAVVLGYVGALVVLLAVLLVTVGVLGWNEGTGALAALGGVAVYYAALWALHRKIEHTIKFTITKNQ
ncbi:MAG: SoxR reducing system RseC family protein [Alistipes senegalensis]|nr:SoxR reducing system RseC family protein [Bacteroides cellulosilyticus]MCM1352445.1 SoxR reducing system RseC family protein [Alistipes senegalensis]